LVLPLLKIQEKAVASKTEDYEELKGTTIDYCKMLEDSDYPLSIKVNS
jgi:hypothetical protein